MTTQGIHPQERTPLQTLAKGMTFDTEICRTHPGGMGGSFMGPYTRLSTPAMKAALWGGMEELTWSLLKTDVIDRRYVDKDHFTMDDLIRGAFSEANRDLNDMPMAGMTRPPFAVLDERGGRYNHALWSEVYPFPCQKSVGQVIVRAPDMKGAPQSAAVHHLRDGHVTVSARKDDKSLTAETIMGMERNVLALRLHYDGLTQAPEVRLYRNVDQGHRRYMDEQGQYIPTVVYRPANPDEPLGYYDFEADRDVNGLFEPPTTGRDGRFFWIHQVFPAEKTFPEGFRYVMMAMVGDPQAELREHPLAHGLGTKPYIGRDSQGVLQVPGIRTTTHPEMFEIMATNYTYVAGAPGVAAAAQTAHPHDSVLYVAVVTCNDTPDYMNRARELLLEAEAIGFDGLARENEMWYNELYARREEGRVVLGTTEEERAACDRQMVLDAFASWTSGHMGFCRPRPSHLEGSASYACYEVDTQSWHSLPCYNEIFAEGPYFLRNRPEPKLLWPELIETWHETLKKKARLKFGLPGMCMAHGYLPAAAQSPWYMENNALDFTMEVPGQIMKCIWNFWDYVGDEDFLRRRAWPILRDLAIFYEAFARRGWDGHQFNLEPTVETESYGVSYQLKYTRNCTGTIAMFRWVLNRACEAAEYLGEDENLIPGWREVAEHLPPYPTFRVGSGEVIGANEMAFPRFTRGDHFMFTGYFPVNMADEINLDSPQDLKDMMTRTADVLGSARNWEPYVLTGACKDEIPRKYAYGAQKITDHAMLLRELEEAPERLMNSRSGRIHLFPAVPDWTECAFRDFLARGGFRVSAARTANGVESPVTIAAARSISCRLMNPWPGCAVRVTDAASGQVIPAELDTSNGECVVFQAEAGRTYNVSIMK